MWFYDFLLCSTILLYSWKHTTSVSIYSAKHSIVKSTVLQKYGADKILETFMDGIKSLEKGVCNTVVYIYTYMY